MEREVVWQTVEWGGGMVVLENWHTGQGKQKVVVKGGSIDKCRTEQGVFGLKKFKRRCYIEQCGWEAIGDKLKPGLQCDELGRVQRNRAGEVGDDKQQCDGHWDVFGKNGNVRR